MALRISNLRLSLDEPEASLPDHLARALRLPRADIRRWRILRKSLDARNKDRVADQKRAYRARNKDRVADQTQETSP